MKCVKHVYFFFIQNFISIKNVFKLQLWVCVILVKEDFLYEIVPSLISLKNKGRDAFIFSCNAYIMAHEHICIIFK